MLEHYAFLEPDDWLSLDAIMIRQQFDTGDLVLAQGVRTPGVYLIRNGTAAVQIDRQPVTLLQAGETFGEVPLVCAEPAGASVVAGGPLVLELLPAFDLATMIRGSESFAARFYRSVAALLARRLQASGQAGRPV